jgi:hypothetical protein
VATTRDTTISAATKFAWGVRNPLPTRTFPAGENELKTPMVKTVQMEGDKNVMLISSRPSFNGRESILLHFRELDGLPARIELSSQIANRPVKSLTQVNITGEKIQELDKSILFNPNEVKFIEVGF